MKKSKVKKKSGIFFDELQYIKTELNEFAILSRGNKRASTNKRRLGDRREKQKRSKSGNLATSMKRKLTDQAYTSKEKSGSKRRITRKKLPEVNVMSFSLRGKIGKGGKRGKRKSIKGYKRSYSEKRANGTSNKLGVLKESSSHKKSKKLSKVGALKDGEAKLSYLDNLEKNQRRSNRRYNFWKKNTIKQPSMKTEERLEGIPNRSNSQFIFDKLRKQSEERMLKKENMEDKKVVTTKVLKLNKRIRVHKRSFEQTPKKRRGRKKLDESDYGVSVSNRKNRMTILEHKIEKAKIRNDSHKDFKKRSRSSNLGIQLDMKVLGKAPGQYKPRVIKGIPDYYKEEVKEKFMLAHHNEVGSKIREQMSKNVLEFRLLRGFRIPDFPEERKINLPESKPYHPSYPIRKAQ